MMQVRSKKEKNIKNLIVILNFLRRTKTNTHSIPQETDSIIITALRELKLLYNYTMCNHGITKLFPKLFPKLLPAKRTHLLPFNYPSYKEVLIYLWYTVAWKTTATKKIKVEALGLPWRSIT